MAYFALLWKARTIEKCRIKYEKEKTKSMLASSQTQQNTWFQKFRLYRCDTQKRISSTFKKMYPEGSGKSIFFIYLKTDQTFPNFVLKSVVGFIGGIILTYICFIFFVFQLSISLIHATVMSSIIGVLLTLGLAFSYRIRCLVFLLIPQFFSRVGRYSLTCYALVLILTGPATNTLKNSEVLSESMACRQEQIKSSSCQITEATKKPLNAMKNSLGVMMERFNLIAMKMKKTIINVQRLVMSVESLINLSSTWLEATARAVNKTLKTPYERCVHVLEDGADTCRKYLGPDYWACNTPYAAEASCGSVKPYHVFCSVADYVDGLIATVRKKLKTFTERVRTIFAVDVHIHHSYSFSSNASRTASQIAAGIVTEIRNRADPLLTWLSWSSCVTSLFLLLIIFRAKYYQHMYETRSRFDNRYITKELRQLDLDRQRQGRDTVLPLNRRERAKYVTTTSFRLVSSEKVHLSRSAVFMVITTLKLLIHMIADYSLYWVLMTIRYHGRFQTALPAGIQNVGVQVSGKGFVAGLLRSLVGTLNIPLTSSMLSPASCLPMPYPPDFRRYSQIGILIFLLWFFALFEPYGLRLRHIIMRHYRPERAKARAIWLYNHLSRTQASFMKFSRRKLHREYFYTSEAKHTFRRWVNDRIRFKWLQVLLGTCEIPHCLLCGVSGKSFRTDTKLIRCKTPKCPGMYCASCFTDIGQLCTICLAPKDYGDFSDESLEKGSSDDESDFYDDSPPTYSGENSSSIENDYHQSSKESSKKNTRLYTKSSENYTKETHLQNKGQHLSKVTTNIKTKFKSHRNKPMKKSNTESHKAFKSRNIIIKNSKKKKKHSANIKINECMNPNLKPAKQFPINRLFHRLRTLITPGKRKRKPIQIKVPFSTSVEKFIKSRHNLLEKPIRPRTTRTPVKKSVGSKVISVTRSIKKLRRKRPQRNDPRIFLDVGEFNNTNIKKTNKHNSITCSHFLTISKDNDSTDQNKTNSKGKNKRSSKEKDKINEKQEPVEEKFEKEKANNENADKFKKTSKEKPNSKNVHPNNKTDSHKSFDKISFLFKYWKGCITNIIPCTDCFCSEVVESDENKSFKTRKKEIEPQAENLTELKTSSDKEAVENARNYRISAYLAEQQWGTNDEDINAKKRSDSTTSKGLERLNWKTEDDIKTDSITATNSLKNCVVNLQWNRKPESPQNCECGNGICECLEKMSAILEENSLEQNVLKRTALTRFRQKLKQHLQPSEKLLTNVTSVRVSTEAIAEQHYSARNCVKGQFKYYQTLGLKDFDNQNSSFGDYSQKRGKEYLDKNCEHTEGGKTYRPLQNYDERSTAGRQALQYQAESNKDNHNCPQDAEDKEIKKAIKQRRGPLLAIRQLCSNILTVSSVDRKSQVEKKRLNNASKGVLVYPITNACGCQHSNNNNYSKDQCIQVRLCRSENNVLKSTKCLCDTGVSAVNKTCTCATQNFKVKNDGSVKIYKGIPKAKITGLTKCHRNINVEARSKSADSMSSYSKFEENLTKETYPLKPKEFKKQVEVSQSLSSITQSLSSIFSDGTRTDTTVCSIATIEYRGTKARKRVRIVTKANQATTTEKKRVCDVSTTTDDWWSPLIERRDKDLYLEKKRGGHVLQKGDRVHFHREREKGKERHVFKNSTGVATDRKLVTFRSRAQIIPADIDTADILSPSRYLLESQKYYNELFSSKFYAPHVFPATQIKKSPELERMHQPIEIRHQSRRNSKEKKVEDSVSPRRKKSPKRRNPGYTTENLKKHRNRTSIHSVKKNKLYKKQREEKSGINLGYQRDSEEGVNFC